MLAKGNGKTAVCVSNLLKTQRGEVPYDRIKGVDFSHVDGPAPLAAVEIAEDAKRMLEIYEPRGGVEDVTMNVDDVKNGHFVLTAKIKGGGTL